MHICLFDIDGTLISSAGAGKAAMEAALEQAFGITGPTDGVPYAGRTDRAITRDLFATHGIPETPDNWAHFRGIYLECLPRELHAREGMVLPGVVHLLEQLAQRTHVKLGLLTGNTQAGALHKLRRYELAHHFHFGGYGDHHYDRCDVAREALAAVHREISPDIRSEQIWVIGDTPADVTCARAIGAKVIAVATGVHTCDDLAPSAPDLLLPDCADPTPLLDLWQ